MVVGAGLMCWRMRSGTVLGVTLSMNVKAGSSRTVVGAEACGWSSWSGGRGMFDAESINFCQLISPIVPRSVDAFGVHAPAQLRTP